MFAWPDNCSVVLLMLEMVDGERSLLKEEKAENAVKRITKDVLYKGLGNNSRRIDP